MNIFCLRVSISECFFFLLQTFFYFFIYFFFIQKRFRVTPCQSCVIKMVSAANLHFGHACKINNSFWNSISVLCLGGWPKITSNSSVTFSLAPRWNISLEHRNVYQRLCAETTVDKNVFHNDKKKERNVM